MKRRIFLALKVFGSVILIWLIVRSADWRQVGEALASADRARLIIVGALMVFCVTFSAYKWWLLLRLHRACMPFNALHRWYFAAMFFNNFLPTSIGGDGFRIYRTLNNPRSKATAFVAVFAERVSGILSLLALGYCAALIIVITSDAAAPGLELARTVAWFGSAGVAGVLLGGWVVFGVKKLRTVLGSYEWPQKLRDVANHGADYTEHPRASGWLIAVSVLFHVISIAWMVLLVQAIGGDLNYLEMTVIAALLSLVSILPLSINGIGLLDGSFIVLAGLFGLPSAQGLTFMIIMRAILILISVAGAIVYLFDRREQGAIEASHQG